MRKLGRLCFQEFLSCWRIKEQIPNRDRRAGGKSSFLHLENFAAINFDDSSRFLIGSSSFEMQAADRGNGWQGFATKTQSRDTKQIFGILHLRSCMTLKGEQSVVAYHAAPVICDLY